MKLYILFQVNGRLGNLMIGYAIMLSMKLEYGFPTFLDTAVVLELQHYFKQIKNVSNTESLCFNEYPWTDYNKSPQSLARDKKLSTGRAIQYIKGVHIIFYKHIVNLIINREYLRI